ncbi:MAG: tRNA adenosine(34) deaminase TadA [candidate division WOR-3 bacterium]
MNDRLLLLQPDSPVPIRETDERWMRLALAEARAAEAEGEVPVGAVAVHQDRVIGRGHNRNNALRDPTAHAEIIALSAAAGYLKDWRTVGVTLYATVEPCLMCTGALILARATRLVFGVRDDRFGACGSVYDIPWDNRLNHRLEVTGGVLETECRQILQSFFRLRRKEN